MNTLSIIQQPNKWQPDSYFAMFATDGIAFDEWLSVFVDKQPFDPNDINNIKGLVHAFDLYNMDEMLQVWSWLGHIQAGDSKLVPLLVCPDDVDLSCIVIVAEQVVTENTVIWQRFGRDTNVIEQTPDHVDWFSDVPSLVFKKDNFIQVFNDLKDAVIQDFQTQGQNISIMFPTEHDVID